MRTSTLRASLVLALSLVACGGESAPPEEPELPPLVGALEVPISLRTDGATPSNALRIEISPSAMHVDGHALYDLNRGEPPDSELTAQGYTQLRERVASLPARGTAALTIHGIVPYGTFVHVLETLLGAGYHEFAVAVRGTDATQAQIRWMTFSSPEIAPARGPVAFAGTERPWEDFTTHWAEVYDACRDGHYIDCDGQPTVAAPGGHLQVLLWARGDGMIIRFNQTDMEDAGVPAGPAPVEMLPGVPQPTSDEEPPPRPFTTGAFSFRADEATQADSAMSTTTRPVCAAAVCPTLVEADEGTAFMRVMSMIGAAFPSGSQAPRVAFRMTAS